MMSDTELEVMPEAVIQSGPEGVDAPEAGDASTAPENPREAMLREIVENRAKQIEYENGVAREMAGEEPKDTESVVAKDATTETQQEPVKQEVHHQEQPRHSIDIGGQRYELTQQEIEYLAKVGAHATISAQQQPQYVQPQYVPEPQPQPVVQQPQQDPAFFKQAAKDLAKTLMYGDEDAGAEAILNFVQRTSVQQQQLNPEALAQYAAAQAIQRITVAQNLQQIGTEYGDVFADKGLSTLARDRLQELQQHYTMMRVQKPDLDLYREACQYVRDRYVPQRQLQPEAQQDIHPVQSVPKLERKRAAPKLVSGASHAASIGQQELRFPTGSEIVESMRKARHQISMR